MNNKKYPRLIRILHWIMAIAIFGMIPCGWYMAGIDEAAPNKYDLYPLHESFGLLVFIFLLLRLIVRLKSSLPELPESFQKWEKRAARLGHSLLYLLMAAVPVSGFIMVDAYEQGRSFDFFGITLPDLVTAGKELYENALAVHGILPYLLLAMIIVHLIATLKHRFFDKSESDVLPRILGLRD